MFEWTRCPVGSGSSMGCRRRGWRCWRWRCCARGRNRGGRRGVVRTDRHHEGPAVGRVDAMQPLIEGDTERQRRPCRSAALKVLPAGQRTPGGATAGIGRPGEAARAARRFVADKAILDRHRVHRGQNTCRASPLPPVIPELAEQRNLFSSRSPGLQLFFSCFYINNNVLFLPFVLCTNKKKIVS